MHDDYVAAPPPGTSGGVVQPLWPGGAARHGARFTPRAVATAPGSSATAPIDCLYVTEDELTPLVEVAGVLRPPASPVPLRFEPQVVMTVDGVLDDVLDLTDGAIQRALGTSHQELTAPWLLPQSRHLAGLGPPPPTQALGAHAFHSGAIVGLRYSSAKHASGVCAVIFTARLRQGHHALRVFNRAGGRLQQQLP